MNAHPNHPSALDGHRCAVEERLAGALPPAVFCARMRALPLPEDLPPAFGQALADLLDRIESSALFSGESCSFSETDLNAALQLWLEKA